MNVRKEMGGARHCCLEDKRTLHIGMELIQKLLLCIGSWQVANIDSILSLGR